MSLTGEERIYCRILGLNPGKVSAPFLTEEGKQALSLAFERYERIHLTSDRELNVLRYRYGVFPLTDEERAKRKSSYPETGMRTLSEVGALFKVTRERIRQIEMHTIKLLGYPSYGLKNYGGFQ